MLFHDSVANAQTQSSAFADPLGGKKRIENSVRMTDPWTIVPERHFHKIFVAGRGNFDARTLSIFAHGIVSIVQNIQEHLLQLVRISDDEGQVIAKVSVTDTPRLCRS